MKRKLVLKRIGLFLLLFSLSYIIYYCWVSIPVATGYGAKMLCSGVFVSGRTEADVKSQDLHFTPLTWVTYNVNYSDSSVTCSLLGLGKQKAIYRTGLGSTLINDLTESEVRAQKIQLAKHPAFSFDTLPWPLGEKLADTLPAGIDSLELIAAVKKFLIEPDTVDPIRTRALVVVYKNQIVAEEYGAGFNKNTKLNGWSMTKSITSALVGILAKTNRINIDSPAAVPEWNNQDDPRHTITVRHLLQQASGLEFQEVYSKSSSATIMLSQKGDMGGYAASFPLRYPAGSKFYYSSGNSNILSRLIRHKLGDSSYHAFPYEELFFKTGMFNTVMEPDAAGNFVGSSYCYATARDWARFGLLYLNNGFLNGEQILSPAWIRESVKPVPVDENDRYGFQWWLNAGKKNGPEFRMFPSLPADLFYADGYEGQNIFVVPSKQLVVVRLGLTRKRQYGEEVLLKSIIDCISH